MFKDFVVEKIGRQIRFLADLRYRDILPVKEFLVTLEPENFVYPGFLSPNKSSKKIGRGEFWSGRDRYLWFHTELEIPKEWSGKEFLGVFDLGLAGGGYIPGFEALIFLNGHPYQGLDSNHREVFFRSRTSGKKPALDFRLWTGMERGGPKRSTDHQIKTAFFCILEPVADELYYLLQNMVLAVKELANDDPLCSKLQNVLVEGYKFLDFTNPGSEAFFASALKTLDYYRKALKILKAGCRKDVSVSFIGHTHIDLAWLWRYKHAQEKGERSFSTALRLMERYPEYIFFQTQAQLYDSIKENYPELFRAIAKRVAEGRWEASGSMWVEADCNIPSGESLVRQILYGKLFFKREFGVENTFLWLPDVFGYNWALPQILKKSGIDTFITIKISWNEINRMPHDTFQWTGMDGSTVLVHFITTPDMGIPTYYSINGEVFPKTVRGIWTNYQDKGLNQDLLFSYGYGDGGGGAPRDMLENIRAIGRLPGFPAVKTERVDSYLKRLHRKISDSTTARLFHNWDRELYLEFHRGTYTSQAYTKKMNRRLELLYRDAEILQSLSALKNKKWDEKVQTDLHEGWKLILKAQFHDIIPGTSISEVYEDTRRDHCTAWDLGKNALESATSLLADKDKNAFTVINTAGWKRGGMVKLPLPEKKKGIPGAGSLLTQNAGSGREKILYAYIPAVPPLGTVSPGLGSAEETGLARNSFGIRKTGVDTPFYKIRWNNKGQLISIWDKSAKREVLKGPGNELQIFENRPRSHDAWEIEAVIDLKREIIDKLVSVKVEESGPLFVRIAFVWSYNKSTIRQDLILYAVHKRIDFKTKVDWQERSKLLKTCFPVDVRSVNARYEIQYGSLERSATRSTSWDEAQFEVVGHQWADYAEKGFGIALMNDSKYGYDIKEGIMRLSLLKSAEHPDTEADRGLQEFTYALYVHTDPWYDSDLIPLAWDLNAPLIAVSGKLALEDLIEISSSGTALDAIKKSEEGKDLIIRFHEIYGGRSKLRLDFAVPISGWTEADLMERPLGDYIPSPSIMREFRPFEIVTFRIKL